MAAKTKAAGLSLVRLRVDLVRNGWQDFQEGDVSRTVLVRQKHALEQLHQCIFKAFERFDEHMYEFIVGEDPNVPDAEHYGMEDAFGNAADMGGPEMKIAARARIASLGLKPGEVFFYVFDSGDGWEQQIAVEAVDLPAEKGRRYPRVEKAASACPVPGKSTRTMNKRERIPARGRTPASSLPERIPAGGKGAVPGAPPFAAFATPGPLPFFG